MKKHNKPHSMEAVSILNCLLVKISIIIQLINDKNDLGLLTADPESVTLQRRVEFVVT